jgi:hypothetical protein
MRRRSSVTEATTTKTDSEHHINVLKGYLKYMATITFHHAGRAEIANLISSTREKKTKLRVPEHKSISYCTETFSQSMMCHSFSGTSIFSFSIIFNTLGHHDTQS